MNKKVIYISITVMIAALMIIIFKFTSNQEISFHDTAVNEKIIQVKSFHVNSDSTDLQTSVKGSVFIKGNDGEAEHIQIVASIEIDPNDWGGAAFYIPKNWYISNINSSYPENGSKLKTSEYVTTWTTAEPDYEWNTMIEVGRERNYIPTGGGTGFVVIDLVPNHAFSQSETYSISVAVGSDEKNGIKIVGPDSIKIPITNTVSK